MMPVTIHTIIKPPDDPTSRTMPAETRKMPEPIIDPATSMVLSKRPRRCWKPVDLPGGGLLMTVSLQASRHRRCASHFLAKPAVPCPVDKVNDKADDKPHQQAEPRPRRQEHHHAQVNQDSQWRDDENGGAAEWPRRVGPTNAQK